MKHLAILLAVWTFIAGYSAIQASALDLTEFKPSMIADVPRELPVLGSPQSDLLQAIYVTPFDQEPALSFQTISAPRKPSSGLFISAAL